MCRPPCKRYEEQFDSVTLYTAYPRDLNNNKLPAAVLEANSNPSTVPISYDVLVRKYILTEAIYYSEYGPTVYGTRLPRCDGNLTGIYANVGKELNTNVGFTSLNRDFVVEKRLGGRSFRVIEPSTSKRYFLKLEPASGLEPHMPSLRYDVFFTQAVGHHRPKTHFLKMFDSGKLVHRYNFIMMECGDVNLSDMRYERLGGVDYTHSTAMHLAFQTLQCVHDVHVYDFIHRDIRPTNFIVGLGSHHMCVYIVNFQLAYSFDRVNRKGRDWTKPSTPRRTSKLSWVTCRFQSRSFHTGAAARRIDDIESWLYVMIDLFDQRTLPWRRTKSERHGFTMKERLFMGDYETELGDLLPYVRILLRYIETVRTRPAPMIDYPFFVNVLEQLCSDWKLNKGDPLDWEPTPCGTKNMARGGRAAHKQRYLAQIATAQKSVADAVMSAKTKKMNPAAMPVSDPDFDLLPVINPGK
uniref:Protein kinase domain-containing protein n=1 Tax=Panagrellus redivivus TaxID=6233 RepID=A0A7E4VKS7_PANRE